MNGSGSDPPLLSQDEFFRHLSLQSVHHNRVKYHYRQALKERLRATSYAKTVFPDKKQSGSRQVAKKSPQVSPCKMLSESQCHKLFGRPKIRLEKPKSISILYAMIQNCHVLRHPGVKKEFETCATSASFPELQVTSSKSAMIEIRKTYLPDKYHVKQNCELATSSSNVRAVHSSQNLHCVCVRPQPGQSRIDKIESQENVRKLATLAMFGHSDCTNLKPFGPTSVANPKLQHQPAVPLVKPSIAPKKSSKFPKVCLSGSAAKLLSKHEKTDELKPLKLLKETQMNKLSPVRTGLQKNPGLSTCKSCGKKFKMSSPLRNWKEAILASNSCTLCAKCSQPKPAGTEKRYICDICNKLFGKRSNMIRHVTNNHPLKIHKVELAKFAHFKTPKPVDSSARAASWLQSPSKHLNPLISA